MVRARSESTVRVTRQDETGAEKKRGNPLQQNRERELEIEGDREREGERQAEYLLTDDV